MSTPLDSIQVLLTGYRDRALADAMPDRCRAMVVIQAGLGLRIGELLALRLQDVDFARRTVRIEWQFAPQSKIRSEPKNPRSKRLLPLPQVVVDALEVHIGKFPPLGDGTLFWNRQGAPFRHDWYGTVLFRPAVAKAGLPIGTTSHDLRLHYAAVLLEAGQSIATVADRLGHSNPGVTLKTYSHMLGNTDDQSRKAVDDAWRADDGSPSVGVAA